MKACLDLLLGRLSNFKNNMDNYKKYMTDKHVKYNQEIDSGKVPNDLSAQVKEVRKLAEKYQKQFPPISDAYLARAIYFSKGPKRVLRIIEELFDLSQIDFKKGLK